MIAENKNWFESWFDSPYYHLLYKDRDEQEAEMFIANLINYLKPSSNAFFLDVACGKGRHAVFMNKLGFKVDAFDLSKNSIEFAKKFENEKLKFFVNEIRKPLKIAQYDFAFNLFTSFGYFVREQDNIDAICAISKSLKQKGVFVMDFMNTKKIVANLVAEEIKTVQHIDFNIKKKIIDNFLVKEITFTDKGKFYKFTEQVKTIYLDDFLNYFKAANLKIIATFGDYNLNAFDENNSDRLILIVTAKNIADFQ